jgi:hypothetical protein
VTGRTLVIAAAVLLVCGTCGDGDATHAVGPTTTSPSTPHSTEPVVVRPHPVRAIDLCASREGLSFHDSRVGAPGASTARGAAHPWLAPGEQLGTAPGRPGRRVVSLARRGQVREVLTLERQGSSGRWYVERATGCLTRDSTVRPCADTVVFRGTTYHRPTYDIPGPGDQIGVGRPFGQGKVPTCADVTAYAGPGRHLVGTVAPVTVYQEEEVPMADSVVTSPATVLGPRIYDGH